MKEITLKVKSAEVLLTNGMDEVFLHVDMPSPYPIMGFAPAFQINTQANYGEEWTKKCLGISPKVVDVRSKNENAA